MTHKDIYNRYGIDSSKLVGWETGVIAPETEEVRMLTEYFRISQEYLSEKEFEEIMKKADDGAAQVENICKEDDVMQVFEMFVKLSEEEQLAALKQIADKITDR